MASVKLPLRPQKPTMDPECSMETSNRVHPALSSPRLPYGPNVLFRLLLNCNHRMRWLSW
ncbi:hypothetical protein DAI22_04g037966 [Oryza sativa Japonica Group]|nr:hypothetical protein DAI22_04g037966 [Oryza sativa Japonica Group]